MKSLKIFLLSMLIALPFSANASDLPNKKPSISLSGKEKTHYDWTGFYIGGTLGYGWHKAEHCDSSGVPACEPYYPHYTAKGSVGGLTLGYNVNHDHFIIGVEGDYSFASLKWSLEDRFCGGPCASEVTSIGTVRARLGYAFDRLLPYVTLGVALTSMEASGGVNADPGSRTESSFVAGIGLEYALARNWSAKIEYLHFYNNGDFDYDAEAPEIFLRSSGIDIARVGLNYKF